VLGSYVRADNIENGNIYATMQQRLGGSISIVIIDGKTNDVIDKIVIGDQQEDLDRQAIAYNPTNGNMYIVSPSINEVVILGGSTNTVIGKLMLVTSQKLLHLMRKTAICMYYVLARKLLV
jgi:DNA-binding beta-propeller fold protein YncE